jgi:murein DD-endopeptidase MepM/ murein hydrolase activator NlpD
MKIKLRHLLRMSLLAVILTGLVSAAPAVWGQYSSVDQEINDLNLKIQNQKKQLDTIQAQQQQYQTQINAKQNDSITLNNQLTILSDQLASAQLDIDSANLQIDQTNLEIKKIELDSASLDQKIEEQKQHLADLLKSMYKQDQVSTLEALLLNNSLSDFLNQAKYLADTNQEIGNNVEALKLNKEQLDQNKQALDQKNTDLLALKAQLAQKQDDLTYEQNSKTSLLQETKSSEQQYQTLLEQAKQQQQQAEADISASEQLIREKMSTQDQTKLNTGNNTIVWPVPKNVINTKFHDPDYPYRTIIGEHPGIDIRAKQGTLITAAADGYVGRVKFDGTKAYAYIMLIHGNGLSTVYGHISAAYVVQDQYVTQGEPIGRTGATPGSIGAGPFTTGPHLHFEVRLNGIPVDPLNYLP